MKPAACKLMVLAGLLGACSNDPKTLAGKGLGLDGGTRADGPPQGSWPLPAETPTYAGAPVAPEPGDLVLRETVTGSVFNLRGQAIAGPLAEMSVQLVQRPSFTSYWFGFATLAGGAEVFGGEPLAPFEPGGTEECLVPKDEIRSGGPPPDGIPSLPAPAGGAPSGEVPMVAAEGATGLAEDGQVLGVFFEGEARAYPHSVLWWHEIANDRIGARRFSVTYCPLTGSGLVFDGALVTFGTSGRLYNSNLVMYDHQSEALWSQLRRQALCGPDRGHALGYLPVVETTWRKWKALYPDTKVVDLRRTGYERNYARYPYGDFQSSTDVLFPTRPSPEPRFHAKDLVFVVQHGAIVRGYPYPTLDAMGEHVVLTAALGEREVVIAYQRLPSGATSSEPRGKAFAVAFEATVRGLPALHFERGTAP